MDAKQGTPVNGALPTPQQPAKVSATGNKQGGTVREVADLIRAGQGLGPSAGDDDPRDREPGRDGGPGDDDGGDDGADEGEPAGADEGELADEGAGDVPTSLDDAARRLNMTRQELNKLPVQVGDQTMTLGELKAKLPELLKVGADREKLSDERGEWELEKVSAHRNIRALVDMLPPQAVTPQVLRELNRQHETTRSRELEALHAARPQWADSTYATGQRDAMLKLAQRYGIGRAEVQSVMDHRQLLLLQDFAALTARVAAGKDAGRKVGEGAGEPKRPAQGAPAEPTNSQRGKVTREDMARRVSRIIRG